MARILYAALLCLVAACFPCMVEAQTDQQPLFTQSDLDQMLAPVALYPDDLLSNVLTASTYPLEVVQADRYVKQNPNLAGDTLADALNSQPWDASVKALTQFPAVLAMMDDELSWTEELGNAFLAQPTAVMDTVQSLRAKAAANGSLQSNTEQVVQSQGNDISIQPATPDVVYVPYYDPSLVYGVWWWPAQLPLFWNPPPFYRPYNFGNIGAGGIAFGGRVAVNGAGFSRFRPNWGAHTISVGNPRRGANAGNIVSWQHDPVHRLGMAYRSVPSVNRALQQATPPRAQSQSQSPSQLAPHVVQPEVHRPPLQPVLPVQTTPPPRVETAPHPGAQSTPAESHPASAQHNDANHGSNDPHKQN